MQLSEKRTSASCFHNSPVTFKENSTMQIEKYTAKDVLDLYFDFEGLQPDQDTWTENNLKDNPPTFYRLKSLQSLFRAFDLGNIQEFAEGTYILKRTIGDYGTLTKQIKLELETNRKSRIREPLTLKDIVFLFKRLLEYRRRWDEVTGFSSGLYACSGNTKYAFYKIEQINSVIRKKISPIDKILASIMSPSGKVISKDSLVKHFDYPDVDLNEIDTEWF
jgi:hypothetical protein